MTAEFDSRVTPARPDVAAKFLEGQVTARRFTNATPMQVTRDASPLHFKPVERARQESQLQLGEIFDVYEIQGSWCWGQNRTDGYVGYVARDSLSTDLVSPTHIVSAPTAHLYLEPDLKSPVSGIVGLGAQVASSDVGNGFTRIQGGLWIFSKNLAALGAHQGDYMETALSLLGTPYLWGGRNGLGLDCSALVQLSLARAGISAPRDSDQQERVLGFPVDQQHDLSNLREGDLIFFPGHVGFVMDGFRFLHANAFDMKVSIHRLSEVLDRARADNMPYRMVRRIYLADG